MSLERSDQNSFTPSHLPGLDALRGIAAMTIATVWHFGALTGRRDKHPVFGTDSLLMVDGYLAVDLFFLLSGMVIAHVYQEKISAEKISVFSYMLKRFARIWPLHFLTLNLAMVFFYLNAEVLEATVSSCKFGAYDYFLNVLFLQSSWWSNGCSFNSPAWTLSIEMFLYLSFYLSTWMLRKKELGYFIVALIGFWMVWTSNNWGLTPNYGRGFFSFYLGVLCLPYFLKYVSFLSAVPFKQGLSMLAGMLSACILALYFRIHIIGFDNDNYGFFDFNVMEYRILFHNVFFFPPLICLFAGWIVVFGENKASLFLGKISFSSYLLHIPLIFALQLVLGVLGMDFGVFHSIIGWLIFVAILLAVSFYCQSLFEMPAKSWISKFDRSRTP